MKGYDIFKQAESLGPEAVRYMIQWFIGSVDCVHEGFTDSKSRADYPHADWAVEQLKNAYQAIPGDLKSVPVEPKREIERRSWSVDDLIRVRAFSGGWRVWRVIGVFLGATNQECVVELETLDRDRNTQGRMCVPYELLSTMAGVDVL